MSMQPRRHLSPGVEWPNIALAVQRFVQTGVDTHSSCSPCATCMKLYDDKPGDDSTVIAMKIRPAVSIAILTGPPADRDLDAHAVSRLMDAEGCKIICGGSTAQMVPASWTGTGGGVGSALETTEEKPPGKKVRPLRPFSRE